MLSFYVSLGLIEVIQDVTLVVDTITAAVISVAQNDDGAVCTSREHL